MTPQRRLVVALGAGLVTGLIAGRFTPWQAAVLIGWVAGATVFLAWVARLVTDERVDIAAVARRDDPGRAMALVLDVGASIGCLAGVAVALAKANEGANRYNAGLVVLAVVSVLVSWAVLHSVFLLHYARLYYKGDIGGIDFNGDPPTYLDFAYLAFTVGMTYQVSDTALQTREIRRHALVHAVLSFFFGTFILAVTINVVASFVR